MRYFINDTIFYFSFFENQYFPAICKNILFKNKPLQHERGTEKNSSTSKIVVLKLFPNYLKLDLNDDLYVKKSIHKPGLAVDLSKKFEGIEDFLKSECRSSFRKDVTRSVRRLETCFNVKYKMFYGSISKPECILLMNKLYTFIENRFKQRSGRNTILKHWDYYTDLAYKGINNKTASLFVIYNNDLPVDISLNFHNDNLMFSYTCSYDIDYGKFSLGNILNYKLIEWCIHNNIALFDIGYGDYNYKRNWVNLIYDFETVYISHKKSLLLQLYAFYLDSKNKLIHFLILKKVNYWFHDTVDKIKKIDRKYVPSVYVEFDCNAHKHDSNVIDINSENSFFLRKPVYDQAYKYQEHIDNLKVYKSESDTNTYIIKGKTCEVGISFN
ncbi:MAG: GNAT family N-acetyltransferase [Algibacter sp.]|uniref:GNAT family N-acetyltransferase n=1 Tax=Algibacter sp. TaxID=1872428 RepID=UPI00262CE513|nr:GNAT family N-acetyltransferase [Algibacter sp.]MDG1729582.1 GNAT family N-acetyltransferase [Algibacter sp.]MDG2179443.1 GNAT family N-acetyltransferase [Algibacter sp.]